MDVCLHLYCYFGQAEQMADVSDIPLDDSAASKEEQQQQHDLPRDAISEDSKSDTKPEGQSEVTDSNLYRYIKEDLFTSEIYKVEIRNLPKFVGFNDLKKFLAKHGLNPHKIKLFGKQTFAFVTFKNEDERDKAMKMVHGMQWKGQVLAVRLAKPKADPILRKRKQQQEEGEGAGGQPSAKRAEAGDKDEPLSVQIANVVTPLWNVPYEEQLKRKEQEVVAVLQRLAKWVSFRIYIYATKQPCWKHFSLHLIHSTFYFVREIGNTNKAMLPWLFAQKGKYNKMCCPLEAIRPSPAQVNLHKCVKTISSQTLFFTKTHCSLCSVCWLVINLFPLCVSWQTEYRNKCEFLISTGANGEDKTIGFRLGKYKGGSCAVVGPADTCHVSAEAKRVVCQFQKFIRYQTVQNQAWGQRRTLLLSRWALTWEWLLIYDKVLICLVVVSLTGLPRTLCTVLKRMKDTGSSWLCEPRGLKKPWL